MTFAPPNIDDINRRELHFHSFFSANQMKVKNPKNWRGGGAASILPDGAKRENLRTHQTRRKRKVLFIFIDPFGVFSLHMHHTHTHTGGMYSVYSEKRNNSVHTRWCRRSFLENRRGTQRVFFSTERTTTVDNAQCNKEFYFFLVSKGEWYPTSPSFPPHLRHWWRGVFIRQEKKKKNEKLFLHPLEIHAHAKMSPSLGALRKKEKNPAANVGRSFSFPISRRSSHTTQLPPGKKMGDRLHG